MMWQTSVLIFVIVACIILIMLLITKVLDQIDIVRIVDARSQPKPNVFPVHAPLINGPLSLQDKKKILSIMGNLRRVKFRKIPLRNLIETLIQLHESGADYVDIIGVEDKIQDVVTLSVQAEYMTPSSNDVPEDIKFTKDKLTDDDINNLVL